MKEIETTIEEKVLRDALINFTKPDTYYREIKNSFDPRLLDYQRQDVRQLCRILAYRNAMVGHEQGCGKTWMAITIAQIWKHLHITKMPTLVICPANLRFNWAEKIEELHPENTKCQIIDTSKSEFDITSSYIIISYELCISSNIIPQLKKMRGGLVVLDEAHRIKSPKSKVNQILSSYITHLPLRTLFMSGTFYAERAIDMYPVLKLCVGNTAPFMNHVSFSNFFCTKTTKIVGGRRKIIYEDGTEKQIDTLRNKIANRFENPKTYCLVRRNKSEVLKELPDIMRSVVAVNSTGTGLNKIIDQAPPKLRAKLTDYLPNKRHLLYEYIVKVFPKLQLNFGKWLSESYRIAGASKIEGVVDYVVEELKTTPHIILFLHHKECFNRAVEAFKTLNISYTCIVGGMKDACRKKAVDGFQNGEFQVFIGQDQAASEGITLTRADTLIFGEVPISRKIQAQAEARPHRIGQNKPVRVITLVSKDSIDIPLKKILDKKRRRAEFFDRKVAFRM